MNISNIENLSLSIYKVLTYRFDTGGQVEQRKPDIPCMGTSIIT